MANPEAAASNNPAANSRADAATRQFGEKIRALMDLMGVNPWELLNGISRAHQIDFMALGRDDFEAVAHPNGGQFTDEQWDNIWQMTDLDTGLNPDGDLLWKYRERVLRDAGWTQEGGGDWNPPAPTECKHGHDLSHLGSSAREFIIHHCERGMIHDDEDACPCGASLDDGEGYNGRCAFCTERGPSKGGSPMRG